MCRNLENPATFTQADGTRSVPATFTSTTPRIVAVLKMLDKLVTPRLGWQQLCRTTSSMAIGWRVDEGLADSAFAGRGVARGNGGRLSRPAPLVRKASPPQFPDQRQERPMWRGLWVLLAIEVLRPAEISEYADARRREDPGRGPNGGSVARPRRIAWWSPVGGPLERDLTVIESAVPRIKEQRHGLKICASVGLLEPGSRPAAEGSAE